MLLLNIDARTKMDYFRNSRFFAGFSPEILSEFEQGSIFQKYTMGETILVEGDLCKGLYLILHGSVKLYLISPTGREFILKILEAGVTFNDVPVFDDGKNPMNACTLEDSTLLIIPREVLHKALQKHPEQCHLFLEHLAGNLRGFIGLIEEMAFYKVTNRLARLLLSLPEEINYTQDQLAARLGTVREVISRALHELAQAGAIRNKRRKVEIIDRSILEIWASRPNSG